MHTQKYSSVRFHHDGDFTGSVLVSAACADYVDVSPSSSEPQVLTKTVITTFGGLVDALHVSTSGAELLRVSGPDADRYSRFDVCDQKHTRVRDGVWSMASVLVSRKDLETFLRLARAYRTINKVGRVGEQMTGAFLAGDKRPGEFFSELEALLERFADSPPGC